MRCWTLILFWSFSMSAWGQFTNKSFYPDIKSVYIGQMTPREIIQAQPVFEISNQVGQLNFDDLSLANRNGLYLRVVHCQADWTTSPLSDIEYLQDFNDIPVRDSQASMGTKTSGMIPPPPYTIRPFLVLNLRESAILILSF